MGKFKRRRILRKIEAFRLGQNEKIIIKLVGLGILVLGSIVFPNLPMVLKPFIKKRGKKEFKRTLLRLEEKGVIYLHGEKVTLSRKGQGLLGEIQNEEIEISRPKRWDGIWRLVSYDIPDYKKKKRDWFRYYLNKFDFEQIQESLWVHPYQCKEEIAVIAQNLGIAPHVIVMETDHLPEQKKLEDLFGVFD